LNGALLARDSSMHLGKTRHDLRLISNSEASQIGDQALAAQVEFVPPLRKEAIVTFSK
jgi:hypothetical protein